MKDDIREMYMEIERNEDYDKNLSAELTQIFLSATEIEEKFGSIDFSLVGESFMKQIKKLRLEFGVEEEEGK